MKTLDLAGLSSYIYIYLFLYGSNWQCDFTSFCLRGWLSVVMAVNVKLQKDYQWSTGVGKNRAVN